MSCKLTIFQFVVLCSIPPCVLPSCPCVVVLMTNKPDVMLSLLTHATLTGAVAPHNNQRILSNVRKRVCEICLFSSPCIARSLTNACSLACRSCSTQPRSGGRVGGQAGGHLPPQQRLQRPAQRPAGRADQASEVGEGGALPRRPGRRAQPRKSAQRCVHQRGPARGHVHKDGGRNQQAAGAGPELM